MFKPTLIAAATTLALVAGSLAVSTGSASAQPYGGPGNHQGWQSGPKAPHKVERAERICKPVFKTVKVRGHRGWHWQTVAVGKRCAWTQPRRW